MHPHLHSDFSYILPCESLNLSGDSSFIFVRSKIVHSHPYSVSTTHYDLPAPHPNNVVLHSFYPSIYVSLQAIRFDILSWLSGTEIIIIIQQLCFDTHTLAIGVT